MKYFIFSIDDGTIYDKKVIEIFNKHKIHATFNLNSGLCDFVWYLGEKPIHRLNLSECVSLYQGHEIASHSLTHPHITMCPDEVIKREVGEDIENLENIFKRPIHTFAFPFHDSDDRCVEIIKSIKDINVIRHSFSDRSFKFPKDPYHVGITSLNIDDALNIFDDFANDKTAELFVFVSHAYDFEVNNNYDKLDLLCKKVRQHEDISVITMQELANLIK